jgi:Zn-dependent peptidase ImmA (M78 family)
MWNYKDLIWKKKTPSNPFEILDPKKFIELLNYAFNEAETLGFNELGEDIAGIINNENDVISISKMYPLEIRNFTTAHELGHALLHDKLIIHRDKPIDKPDSLSTRPIEEKQADKFAACFLIPKKLLQKTFRELFQTDQLLINEETSFALDFKSDSELVEKVKDRRGFARLIAQTTLYASKPFSSLAERFNVSVEAMAIRLEELDLVKMEN